MFDKDKEIGRTLTSVFEYKDEFIVWRVHVDEGAVNTDLGPADKTVLLVSRLTAPDEKFEVNTLASAIADKAREAEADDFPAVVQLLQVQSNYKGKATVLQFVKPFDGRADDIPF